MGKLMYNCAVSPREEKFRRIKLTNKRLAETLGANPAALEALQALGWVTDAANPQELVVAEGLYFTMKEVRDWLLSGGVSWKGPRAACAVWRLGEGCGMGWGLMQPNPQEYSVESLLSICLEPQSRT